MGKHLVRILSEVLPQEVLSHIYSSYDVVGDIAIIRLNRSSTKYGSDIAQIIMNFHRNVKTVLAQIDGVSGDFRLRNLEHISGEKKTSTIHRESDCRFYVDVEKCYFSPRLFYERRRVAEQVRDGEIVVNMFAGVGCFSVVIAKLMKVAKVFSIDVNPVAVQYMKKNISVNGAYGRVFPILGDAKTIVQERLCQLADRVLMPLPGKAFEYLPHALSALKKTGGWIHYYDFEHARKDENVVEKVKFKVAERLSSCGAGCDLAFGRAVRTTGPRWYQVVLDVKVNL